MDILPLLEKMRSKSGAIAGATALGLAGAKRLGSIHRDNKERRKDLTGHSSRLGSKRAF